MNLVRFMVQLLMINQLHTSGFLQIEYTVYNRANKSEAEHICSKYNGFLPYSDNDNDYSKLKDFMTVNGIRTCWLGIHKKIYKTPHWINSTQVDKNMLPTGESAPDENQCGYLSIFEHIEVANCRHSNSEFGTLCVKKCDKCLVESICYKDGSNCYLIFCGTNNWFSAKKLCQAYDADLAILPTNNIKQIANSVEKRNRQCTNFWIGISKFLWQGLNDNIMMHWGWDQHEPSNEGRCVYMKLSDGTIRWHSDDCSNRYDVICSKNISIRTTITTTSSNSEKIDISPKIDKVAADTGTGVQGCCFDKITFIVTLSVCCVVLTLGICLSSKFIINLLKIKPKSGSYNLVSRTGN